MKKNLPVILLLLCGLAFMGLKVRMDQIPRSRVYGSAIIYLPQGTYLRPATLGFSSLAADLVYLWAIQFYSTPEITDRFDYLDHIFSIIFELDPLFIDPYEIGAIISVYEAKNIELALSMLEKGSANNPAQWLFPFQAGHYAQYFLKDFERAKNITAKRQPSKGPRLKPSGSTPMPCLKHRTTRPLGGCGLKCIKQRKTPAQKKSQKTIFTGSNRPSISVK